MEKADEAQDVLARPQTGRQDALEVPGSDTRRRLLVRGRYRGRSDGVRVPDPTGLSVPAGAGRRSHRGAAHVGCGREPSRAADVARVHALARRASLRRRHRNLQRHRAQPPVAGRGRCAGPGGGDQRGGLPCRGGPRTARPHAGRGRRRARRGARRRAGARRLARRVRVHPRHRGTPGSRGRRAAHGGRCHARGLRVPDFRELLGSVPADLVELSAPGGPAGSHLRPSRAGREPGGRASRADDRDPAGRARQSRDAPAVARAGAAFPQRGDGHLELRFRRAHGQQWPLHPVPDPDGGQRGPAGLREGCHP